MSAGSPVSSMINFIDVALAQLEQN
jgi:hypothetical protein